MPDREDIANAAETQGLAGHHPVTIVTYQSANAPAGHQWIAKWLVPVKPSKRTRGAVDAADNDTHETFQTNPTAQGFMPYSFSGPTEQAAIDRASEAWRSSFGKKPAPKAAPVASIFE